MPANENEQPRLEAVIEALAREMPDVLRWGGALAKRLRRFNIALECKTSGSANTDALTLADLTVQELLVAALRDRDPIFQQCRLEGEESTGDMERFAKDGKFTIALDPIDGTKQFRDHTGNGYAVMLNLRSPETVHYSLVYLPELGPDGSWVEVRGDRVAVGPDDPSRPGRAVLDAFTPIDPQTRPDSPNIYLIGFQKKDVERARQVTAAGLKGFAPDEMPGSIYPLLATGEFGGSLIHTPNVYDFPVSLHIARILGGDAVWVHNGEPATFHELWNDERADMLRMTGIIACSANRETLAILVDVAKDWSRVRYEE